MHTLNASELQIHQACANEFNVLICVCPPEKLKSVFIFLWGNINTHMYSWALHENSTKWDS